MRIIKIINERQGWRHRPVIQDTEEEKEREYCKFKSCLDYRVRELKD